MLFCQSVDFVYFGCMPALLPLPLGPPLGSFSAPFCRPCMQSGPRQGPPRVSPAEGSSLSPPAHQTRRVQELPSSQERPRVRKMSQAPAAPQATASQGGSHSFRSSVPRTSCGKNQSSVFQGFVRDLGWSGVTTSLHPRPRPLPHTSSASRWPGTQSVHLVALQAIIGSSLQRKPQVCHPGVPSESA